MLASMPRPSLPPAAALLLAFLPVGIVLPGCNVSAPSAASAPAAAVSDTGRVGRQPGAVVVPAVAVQAGQKGPGVFVVETPDPSATAS